MSDAAVRQALAAREILAYLATWQPSVLLPMLAAAAADPRMSADETAIAWDMARVAIDAIEGKPR